MFKLRLFAFALVCTLFPLVSASSQDTPLQEYINAFSGRWVCDTVADQNIEGYMKKGEDVRMVNVFTPL